MWVCEVGRFRSVKWTEHRSVAHQTDRVCSHRRDFQELGPVDLSLSFDP